MNLRELEYVVAVADLLSFSAAADQCCVSQSTLSGQIKKLEDGLGITIFERTNKRVMPTAVGESIILSARRILSEADAIRDAAQASHDPFAGRFRLGAFPTLASYLLPDLVPRISASMPDLKLILLEEKTDALIQRLKSGTLDVAFLALPVPDDFLVSVRLFDDPFYLAVSRSHPYAALDTIDETRLAGERLLLLEDGHCLRDQSLKFCQLSHLTEDQDFRATSLETLRQMVRAGTAVTLMPRIAARADDEGIRYLPITPVPPSRQIGLVWRKTTSREHVISRIIDIVGAMPLGPAAQEH